MKSLSLTLLVLAVASVRVFAGILAGPVTNDATGHYYYLLAQNSWTASQAEALRLGGDLVTIDDQAEQDWVFTTFTASNMRNSLT